MAHRTAVINVVGLSESLLGEHAPRLREFAARGRLQRLRPVLPAVTCSVQASMLTGLPVSGHGVVGNGWFNRELQDVQFWKQSNRLVQGEKVWETARRRDPGVTCANMFWWFNMASSADIAVTPRPIYAADGRKIPDCWTQPADLRDRLQGELGAFPLFRFWGLGASIESSAWIAKATKIVDREHEPTLTLVYLPHLDYGLQKLGPDDPRIGSEVRAIDEVAGGLISHFESRGVRVMVVSEYGIEAVSNGGAIAMNRELRKAGLLGLREEQDREMLDPIASEAFAVADHQVAHVYVREARRIAEAAALCRAVPGVEEVLDAKAQQEIGIHHARSGELVLVAQRGRWFSYGWWMEDRRAPDFARTVEIHRKPGYDPCELFLDPRIGFPGAKARVAWKLLKRKLGFRALLDVIPLDESLVRGTHGRPRNSEGLNPVLISQRGFGRAPELPCEAVREAILSHLFDDAAGPATA